MTLTTHHLQITATVATPLALDEQSGSAVRGAISGALWERFCVNKAAPTCAACPLIQVCPVAALVAPMRADDEPGSDQRPRPYVVQPPQDGARTYQPGESLGFGLRVFGQAADLFPYLVLAVQELERLGLGRKLPDNRYRRGTLHVQEIAALHPLRGLRQPLYTAGTPQVQAPALAVTAAEVAEYAASLPSDRLTLQFRTPTRIIEQERLMRRLVFRPVIQRLMRRLDDLSRAYGTGPLDLDYQGLLAVAETVQMVDDRTRWVDVTSTSFRQGHRTPIGGLVGTATIVGNLAPLRELLVWGSLVHVGKNAVKGDGWFSIV
ncbi:MAG: CRISPR system precrRNA processing endoribonuclease RAMP protein Cas6 [Chloroflexaceae bacterium]|jgi:hypothetical protein|nr:CRISPR system precrRNA processing endoribonuclease RAMP protein Cas6 [Chloroflexaceae bacterium]